VFYRGPRLRVLGFEWAPRSFLRPPAATYGHPFVAGIVQTSIASDGSPVTDEGLFSVRLPGLLLLRAAQVFASGALVEETANWSWFNIKLAVDSASSFSDAPPSPAEVQRGQLERFDVTLMFEDAVPPPWDGMTEAGFAILLQRPLEEATSTGVLVEIRAEEDAVFYVKFVCRTVVTSTGKSASLTEIGVIEAKKAPL
jgi:hypothetical protein